MNAADVVGYTYDGGFYCSSNCLPKGVDTEDEEVGAVFASEEFEQYPTCGTCGETCEDVTYIGEDDTDDES